MLRQRILGLAAAGTLLATVGLTTPAHAGTLGPVIDPDQQYEQFKASMRADGSWPGAPDPGAKAKSPATSLDAYPKFTEKQLAGMRGNAGEGSGAEVISVRISPEGKSIRIYQPAPGVTAEQLADRLRKRGESDVRIIASETMASNDCSYC